MLKLEKRFSDEQSLRGAKLIEAFPRGQSVYLVPDAHAKAPELDTL